MSTNAPEDPVRPAGVRAATNGVEHGGYSAETSSNLQFIARDVNFSRLWVSGECLMARLFVGARDFIGYRCSEGMVASWKFVILAAIAMVFVVHSAPAQTKKPDLPYVTIDHPQFIAASEATFLSPNDILIGVTDGKTAKAYPAAILAQHGVVQDQMADGPIAVTW